MTKIKVIFEDTELLVLDKPAAIVVNKSDTTRGETTLQDWVEKEFKIQNSEFRISKEIKGKDKYEEQAKLNFVSRAGIVHRLDKETSGIILVAKKPSAFINLQKQFKERKVKKTYLALAHGRIDPPEGEINVEVGRLPWNRKRFGVLSGGRGAVTHYKVIKNLKLKIKNFQEGLSLVELYPKTGRTHQIRVHLQYIKHPVFSDPLYAGRKTSKADRKLLPRIFLHASGISFYHPGTNKLMSFESPLPEDLQNFLQQLSD